MLLAVSALTGGVWASPTADSSHGVENGNYTVNLPFATDHYPRDKNPGGTHNASINHFAAATPELFEKKDVPEGLEEVDFIIISNQDIDFSQCSTSNTAAFGIDRDNDDSGTKTDVGLLAYRKNSEFRDHSIVVEFYNDDDLGAKSREDKGGKEAGREDGDKDPEVYPDDEIVAHQGYKSGGGPCYGMPSEPGWYQITGFINGTGFSDNYADVTIPSHYFYICECQSEEEAYDQLGAPPGQENPYADGSEGGSGSGSTATATATPDSGGSAGASTPTTTPDPTPTPTATPDPTPTPTATPTPDDSGGGASAGGSAGGDSGGGGASAGADSDGGGASGGGSTGGGTATASATVSGSSDGGQQAQQNQRGAGPMTPTAGSGPGFGLAAALGGVLAAALLALRRD
ncbi:hypothetical protein [Haloglomus halophilum]|uniref:hypothetical protein n=1 Tax=Haloglomus halophilum TaxID=2962672 RepID=UPI0020C9FF5F|nr:hypothetical protein [Haloglomus halophilum]